MTDGYGAWWHTGVPSVSTNEKVNNAFADKKERTELHEITEIYRGKVIGLNKDSMVIELTGSPNKLDGFMSMLKEYDIVEVSRTGVTGMARDAVEETRTTGI